MKHVCRIIFVFALLCVVVVQGQLAVTVSAPKLVGQKAVVKLAMTNNLVAKVESAHAVCFLFDEQGQLVGQSTKWVIGGTKDRPALKPKQATTFNFVIANPHPFTTKNLTSKVLFNHVVLANGKLADVQQDVFVATR